jgi:hypothetical protein
LDSIGSGYLQIDAASVVSDVDEINRGMAWAQEVIDGEFSDEESKDSAAFNLANGLMIVSTRVNSVRNNGPELIEPAERAQNSQQQ